MTELILSDSFQITTRTTKEILSLSTKDLVYLIDKIKHLKRHSILSELVEMANANEYNYIELYKHNLEIMKHCVTELFT